MRRKYYLLFILVTVVAFWQVFFLQNGMKWDFVDAFLPSRYFFSESILNNQFPLWNPYLLYGTPIYADLVSVFNPEFWIVGNMFGYTNITLQFIYLIYIFIAGISFFYFLKQFNAEYKLSVGLSVAYMLSGLTIGNAQHLAFVSGYAIFPFVAACYFQFAKHLNRPNFFRLSIALFFMIYCSYPGITIIAGYFLFAVFIYHLGVNRTNKSYLKKVLFYHLSLVLIVTLFSAVLILTYTQISPFLSRFGGLPPELAQKHPFTIKSILSFILPMATGNNAQYFETDTSMSNGYWGIISLVLFLFSLTKEVKNRDSYLILFFGIFSFLASLGSQFFLRSLLYNFAPLMDMFKYPAIFRAFTIFSFLAFIGINFNLLELNRVGKKRLTIIVGLIIVILSVLIGNAIGHINHFSFFNAEKNFTDELFSSTLFDNIIFQGVIQIIVLMVFLLVIWKIKTFKNLATAVLFLFIFDGIVSTQLNIYYTVVGKTNPIEFSKYLKSSPKGFPIPDLNSIGNNTDKNAQNNFLWMNNNVFPKKVTFDGLVAFKLDGYTQLANNYPTLLDSIKKEAVIYFSDDVRENTSIKNFKTNTVFLTSSDYKTLPEHRLHSNKNDKLKITGFSPTKIEIEATTHFAQLLTYQQNFYTGWTVSVDGERQKLLKSNFTHMAIFVPSGKHTVVFEYTNNAIIITFILTILILLILIAALIYYFLKQHPEKKKQTITILIFAGFIFILISSVNRYLYKKNKLGLTPVIIEKVELWKKEHVNNIRVLLSTQQKELKKLVVADEVCFINEKTNASTLSQFLMNSHSKYFAFAWQGGIINDDLFELIYSFYPTIVEQEKDNSSGVILFQKSSTQKKYRYAETFEDKKTETDKRVDIDTVSGNHTYIYTKNNEWGTTIEIQVEKELLELNKILILVDFMFKDKIVETLLVFTAERGGKSYIYNVSKINNFVKDTGIWARATFCVNTKPKLQEGDLLKVYLWNKNRANLLIDNLKVDFNTLQNK